LLLALASCGVYDHPAVDPTTGLLPEEAGSGEGARFRAIAEAYIAWHHAIHPVRATFDGVHDHDGSLGRWSREDIGGQTTSLREYLRRLGGIDCDRLEEGDYFDAVVLEHEIRGRLLEVEAVRSWERNPNFYREIVAGGLYSLSSIAFDAPERRIVLATERLLRVPELLASAKRNLADPPRIYTEIAIDEFGGTHRFLKTGLPAAFASVKDEPLRKRFAEAQKAAVDSVEQFVDWMRKDLLARSKGSFALGAERYRAKLLHEERVETPLDELLRRGYELLKSTQEEMKRIAGDKPVRALLRETAREHAASDRLLDETRGMLDELKRWASTVVNVPADAACRVQETPEFRRSLSFASMEIPGPFEATARDAYYSITLPDPEWPSERKDQHLRFFNRWTLPLISVHEAYPGHYTQFLAVQACPSRVRKAFGSASFSEGWAHYCEQLYVDQQAQAPPALRLHMLWMALLRICRYVAGIELHVNGWTYDQAVELFVNEGWQERVNAEREARRGTMDPTYLVYTLGKLEILRLRDDYLAATGRSLREFHNEFIRHGYPPIPVVRQILLGRGK
jgi:uncharacterized protein (DUF885 family)